MPEDSNNSDEHAYISQSDFELIIKNTASPEEIKERRIESRKRLKENDNRCRELGYIK